MGNLEAPMNLLPPLARAFGQLGDPAILGALVKSLLLTALLFVLIAAAAIGGANWLLPTGAHPGWGWVGSALGVVLTALSAMVLFLPALGGVAMLFVNPVADAVERRFYPALPPARPASLAAQIWDALGLTLWLLLLQLLALLLTILLPGPGVLLGWLVSAWGMGRGLFMAVALRRMPRPPALVAYRARRGTVIVQGGIMVLAGLVPGLNLLAPVLGVAVMVHVFNDQQKP